MKYVITISPVITPSLLSAAVALLSQAEASSVLTFAFEAVITGTVLSIAVNVIVTSTALLPFASSTLYVITTFVPAPNAVLAVAKLSGDSGVVPSAAK